VCCAVSTITQQHGTHSCTFPIQGLLSIPLGPCRPPPPPSEGEESPFPHNQQGSVTQKKIDAQRAPNNLKFAACPTYKPILHSWNQGEACIERPCGTTVRTSKAHRAELRLGHSWPAHQRVRGAQSRQLRRASPHALHLQAADVRQAQQRRVDGSPARWRSVLLQRLGKRRGSSHERVERHVARELAALVAGQAPRVAAGYTLEVQTVFLRDKDRGCCGTSILAIRG
jgi:hypothetical protein